MKTPYLDEFCRRNSWAKSPEWLADLWGLTVEQAEGIDSYRAPDWLKERALALSEAEVLGLPCDPMNRGDAIAVSFRKSGNRYCIGVNGDDLCLIYTF